MNKRLKLRLGFLALFSVPLMPAACGTDGIVGGDCRSGYTDCNGECVSLQSDSTNCGACGNRCAAGDACLSGRCELFDGSAGADAGDGAPDGDASDDQSQGGDGSLEDGADANNLDGNADGADSRNSDGSELDGSNADAACLPPFNTPLHCGDCDTQCTGINHLCSPTDGGFACVPLCDPDAIPELTECSGRCVDLMTDPFNCGRCGNVCPTGLCQAGKCVGEQAGHIVAVCSNYEQVAAASPQTVAFGNAVFLPLRSPVRILAYDEYTLPANKAKVDSLIDSTATRRGRTYELTRAATSTDIASKLNIQSYDVLLVYDQPNAPAGALGGIGTSLYLNVTPFARAGGVIVVLDSGTGRAEMSQFLTNSQLLPVTSESDVSQNQLRNYAPADAIGINVLSPYLAQRTTCTFQTTAVQSASTVFVITPPTEEGNPGPNPVIVHRIELP